MLRIAGVASLVAAASIAALVMPSHPQQPLIVAPGGSDANACTLKEPCASLDRAYRAADPGQVVEVEGGTYSPQTLLRDERKTGTGRVVLRPRDNARVQLQGLGLGRLDDPASGPRNVTLKGMTIAGPAGRQRGVAAFAGTRGVILEDIDAANFYLNGVEDFTIRGGDWGPCTAGTEEVAAGCANSKIDGSPLNHNITIEDAVFHDYRIVPGSGAHFECLIVFGGTDITIRRNRFVNCEFYDIFVQHSSTYEMDGLRIENNWFDTPWNGRTQQNRASAVAFSPRGRPFNDVLVRFNSFLDSGLHLDEDGEAIPYSGFRVVGNIGQSTWAACPPSVRFRANLWIGTACHPTDRTATAFPYVRPEKGPAGDYHLSGGAAVDLVKDAGPDAATSEDIDRHTRPLGDGRDAGAHELR
jgi:hypothetical protein